MSPEPLVPMKERPAQPRQGCARYRKRRHFMISLQPVGGPFELQSPTCLASAREPSSPAWSGGRKCPSLDKDSGARPSL